MKKFIVLYNAPKELIEKNMEQNAEEMKKGMEPWMKWVEKIGEGLVDLGSPLGNGQKLTKSGSEESMNRATGYSILQAESMEKAKEMLKDHPHLEWDGACEIEVFEALPLPK